MVIKWRIQFFIYCFGGCRRTEMTHGWESVSGRNDNKRLVDGPEVRLSSTGLPSQRESAGTGLVCRTEVIYGARISLTASTPAGAVAWPPAVSG